MAAPTTNTGTFQYIAISPTGERVKEKLRAASSEAVADTLINNGWTPVQIKKIAGGGMNLDIGDLLGGELKLKHQELAEFARQLNQMLRAGLTVPKALGTVAEQSPPRLAGILNTMVQKVRAGVTLADAMEEYPVAFDDVFRAYIHSGEESGTLVTSTERLAKMLEKRSSLQRKITAVTAYPKMVAGAIGLMVIGIMMFLVPKYATIYSSFHSALPAPTQFLVDVGNKMMPIKFSFPFIVFDSPLLWVFVLYRIWKWWLERTRENLEVGEFLDRIRFKLPIFGKLNKKLSLYRWSSTLAGALHSGVLLTPALTLAAKASGSRWQQHILPDLTTSVQSGRPLWVAMREHDDLFPPGVRSMIETGEQTGELSSMIDSAADALDDDIDAIVAGLGAKVEVALLMTMGIVVGGILVALYLPILELSSTASKGLGGGSGGK